MSNIVIVPSALFISNTSEQFSILSIGNAVSINKNVPKVLTIGSIIQPINFPSDVSSSFMYDPLIEYMSWYGLDSRNSYTSMKESPAILHKFWNMIEFHKLIIDNCKSIVFVQKINLLWKLVFSTHDDHLAFDSAWNNTEKNHKFSIYGRKMTTLEQIAYDISEWCLGNLTGLYMVTQATASVNVMIREDDEAAIFKLRWMNS